MNTAAQSNLLPSIHQILTYHDPLQVVVTDPLSKVYLISHIRNPAYQILTMQFTTASKLQL